MYAKRVIILPITAFHQLADQLGDPQGDLIFVGNTSRCGSTLLCQIYEETGKCVAFSEPDVIKTITKSGDFDSLAISTMRMLCKPRLSNPDVYVIKMAGPAMIQCLLPLHRAYPRAKLLFMYRDGVTVAQSCTRFVQEDNLLSLVSFALDISPQLQKHSFEAAGFSHDGLIQVKYNLSRYYMMWAVICAKYKELRREGIPIVAVKYEHLVENPEYATRAILEYSGLDPALVSKALAAFGRDSQRDGPLSQQRLRRHKPDEMTPSIHVEMDEISVKTGLPRIHEPCILEHTITDPSSSNARHEN